MRQFHNHGCVFDRWKNVRTDRKNMDKPRIAWMMFTELVNQETVVIR